MKNHLLYLLFLVALFQSCTKDTGTIDITYNKATAIYGDLETVRQIPLLGAVQEIENPGKIFVSNNFILIGEEEKGIHVIDNSDPNNPTPISFINIPGNREFYVQGNSLYAESYYDMLKIDLSDLNQATLETRIELALGEQITDRNGKALIGFNFEKVTEKVELGGDIARESANNEGFLYFDYAQRLIPPSAVPASFAGTSQNAIGSVNRIAFAKDHVYLIGRSNLTVFKDDGRFELVDNNSIGWEMETIYPQNDNLFIGTRNSMMVMSIENPSTPNMVSTFSHAISCDPVYPVDDVAYLTLRTGDFSNCPGDVNALVVLDIQNIENPTEIREIEMQSPYGLSLIGERLYVGEGENGLKIFDASDRKHPKLERSDTNIEAYDIIRHPNRNDLVLIAGTAGLQQYKIEDGDMSLMSQLFY